MSEPNHPEPPSFRLWIAALASGLVLLVLGAYFFQARIFEQARGTAEENLRAVASLKSLEIQRWLGDRLIFLSQPPTGVMAANFARLLDGRDAVAATHMLEARLRHLHASSPELKSVWLYDSAGVPRLGSRGTPPRSDGQHRTVANEVLAKRVAGFIDLHQVGAAPGDIVLEILVPLIASADKAAPAIGYALFQIDPAQHLYPLIATWPVPSASAEAILARRSGDDLEYLSPLRHKSVPPLSLPLASPRFILGQATLTQQETVAGVDYRGEPGLAVALKVPGTEWLLTAKMDDAEVYAKARQTLVWFVATGTAMLFLLLALGHGYLKSLTARTQTNTLVQEVARLEEIAKQVRIETALAESEERLRLALRAANQGLYDLNVQTGETIVSPEYALMLGYDPATFQETNAAWTERLHPDDREPVAKIYQDYIAGRLPEYRVEFRQKTQAGDWKWILSSGRLIEHDAAGKPLRMLGTHTDVTERHRDSSRTRALLDIGTLAGALPEREFLTRGLELAESITDSAIGFLHFVNDDQESIELITWTRGALKGCTAAHDQHYPISQAGIWADCFRQKRPVVFNDYPNFADKHGLPEGHAELQRLISVPVMAEGLVRMMIGVGNKPSDYIDADIDTLQLIGNDLWRSVRRLRLETSLQEKQERLQTIYDSINDAIFIHDPDTGRILDVNAAACQLYGYSREQLLTMDVGAISDGTSYTQETAQARIRSAHEQGQQGFEWLSRDSTGKQFWVGVNLRLVKVGGQARVMAVVRDIDKRKQTEDELKTALVEARALNAKLAEAQSQLLQSEKMASIGQLAAGVAHELNNPIGFVSSNLGTLDGYLKDIFAIVAAYETADQGPCVDCTYLDAARALKREKDFDYLKTDIVQLMAESKDGLARVAKIVRDLKDFSRAGEAEALWADLHQGLDSTLNIVWNELKYKCTVSKAYGELPPVWCVLSQLNQVFMNLLLNAAHAIPEKGEITLRTGRQGDEVFVAISDTGTGIPQENLNRIFDPFFTTKPVGKGTGLGLSLAYSIVKKHHGRIEVQSQVGQGTTFTVWLPIKPPAEVQAGRPDGMSG
ncbi:MAG: PAS domain S-box protein [Betaproteobacteria bacterium]|nr:PAS domain S-box protein [Betaproteobacteria bacterium]